MSAFDDHLDNYGDPGPGAWESPTVQHAVHQAIGLDWSPFCLECPPAEGDDE